MNKRHRTGVGGKPVIFFAPFKPQVSKFDVFRALIEKAELTKTVSEGHLTAIKLHFGEDGNDTYLNPQFAALLVESVKAAGGRPFLTDTSTLYTGARRNAVDHLNLAYRHGFSPATVGAPILMADGLKSNDWREVKLGTPFFDSVKIAGGILDADSLVVLSHFKGHVSAGFGGAVKNLAMGCAPAAGKKDQHAARLVVNPEDCIACGRCARNCPVSAIEMGGQQKNKAFIHKETCIGCSECMTHCPVDAIALDWGAGEKADFGSRMAEYAYGAIKNKTRPVFFNVMMNITPLCDCVGWSDRAIAPDVGIAVSTDPIALDWFCYEEIKKVAPLSRENHEDCCPFKGLHPSTDPLSQLIHGQRIGMGVREADVVRLDDIGPSAGH